MSILLAEGLNPYLGNLHDSDKKEMFLAFDFMEEFKSPVVDTLAINLVNKKILNPPDFTYPDSDGGIYVNDSARRVFLKNFEERISLKFAHPDFQEPISYRRAIQYQIRQYKKMLLQDIPYQPYLRAN